MPRYFFDVRDGRGGFVDDDGVELPNLAAARREALRYAGSLLSGAGDQFWNAPSWTMTVRDSSGVNLITLHLSAADAPSLWGASKTNPAKSVSTRDTALRP